MGKKDSMFIKLELDKHPVSGRFLVHVFFDADAPNFSCGQNVFSWNPTADELSFIAEAFELIHRQSVAGTSGDDVSLDTFETEDVSEDSSVSTTPPVEAVARQQPLVKQSKDAADVEPVLLKKEPLEMFRQADEDTIDKVLFDKIKKNLL